MAIIDFYCDSGQDSTKTYSYGTTDIVRSLVEIGDKKVSPTALTVENFLNVNYIVGDERLSLNKNFNISKADMVHKVCTYAMVHKYVNNGDEVNLVIGTPISLYMNEDHKREYTELMYEPKVEFTVNGVNKMFRIRNVTILPESIGYVYNNIEVFSGRTVGVVDIGSLNINAAIYQDMYPLKGSEMSLNIGASVLKTRIKDALNETFVTNIQDYQIEGILENGLNHPRWTEMDTVIQDVLISYVTEILVELKKRNWDIDTLDIHFTGGGINLIEDIISEVGNFVISENLIFDNVTGFAELGGLVNDN